MSVELQQTVLGDIFIEHRAQLRRIAQKIVGTSHLADEVIQDAYLKVVEMTGVRDILKPFCYCCQVVRNMALDHCRRQAVESSYRIYPDDGELPQVSGGSIPDHQLHGMQVIDAIDRILCGLPSRTRQVFELSRLGGLTQRDIAQEIGCSATLVNFMLRDATQAIACCRELVDIG
ncbi:RNA polymerase sigma-70 factor, ECF subfamily [Duganella sp. CF517]|jgi:RNA polymerase sigma-70 factor (ECF subfamily)|uniref:sigma-70 family RNA polymerase sigma factor n=1 Tax=Duganella sp. CF517 TaxID=1881038 RepID=UPI0008C8E2A8|nr:sigma-70 family RNA polymerase sigma factor [Duganella sp. CF517]SEO10001.1 RNA polymerase sigma-70 factor, ECF subfamily [Duganella sp. CF517]